MDKVKNVTCPFCKGQAFIVDVNHTTGTRDLVPCKFCYNGIITIYKTEDDGA